MPHRATKNDRRRLVGGNRDDARQASSACFIGPARGRSRLNLEAGTVLAGRRRNDRLKAIDELDAFLSEAGIDLVPVDGGWRCPPALPTAAAWALAARSSAARRASADRRGTTRSTARARHPAHSRPAEFALPSTPRKPRPASRAFPLPWVHPCSSLLPLRRVR